jgi:hypothetical protein
MIEQQRIIKRRRNKYSPCCVCGDLITGRPNKKYCSIKCKNLYNNNKNAQENYSKYVRSINNALLKNRRILGSLLTEDSSMIRITRDNLHKRGFRFKFFTHTHTTKTGRHFIYCYDLAYMSIDNDWVLVIRKADD